MFSVLSFSVAAVAFLANAGVYALLYARVRLSTAPFFILGGVSLSLWAGTGAALSYAGISPAALPGYFHALFLVIGIAAYTIALFRTYVANRT